MTIKTSKLLLCAALLSASLSFSAAYAQTAAAAPAVQQKASALKVFGESYAPIGPVPASQAQVVYYRPGQAGNAINPANVYVDGEFHTALLQGGYSSFCVSPGKHTLGAYMKDEPYYRGKTTNRFQADLAGGTLYFLKVREDGSSGAPLAVARDAAELELKPLRNQVHALSRASAVTACQSQPAPAAAPAAPAAPAYRDYTLNGDVLFAFGKSAARDMKAGGRAEMAELAQSLQAQMSTVSSIKVIGHADQIGSDAAAQQLGAARAATVRSMLIENGVPAALVTSESMGNREPVVDDCKGSLQARIACYQPNRRVVVRVAGRRPG